MTRTWAPDDRLVAEDLNAAFAEVAAGRMPGVICAAGAEVSVPNVATELPIGAPSPPELNDSAGYWSGDRLTVPRGLAGPHVARFQIAGMAAAAKGDFLRVVIHGLGFDGSTL